ncbi:MAG: glycosyltransferase family A protein [Acidobacteriota bacterium]
MSKPLVSVIIPVYNGERYLAAALGSVTDQDYEPVEIIVIDDGSTDQTAAVARSLEKARYIYQPNQGHAVAKNAGIAAARGEFLTFLDADDVWMKGKLTAQIGFMIEHPEVGYTIVREKIFLEPGAAPPPGRMQNLFEGDHPAYVPSALAARRSVFDQIGGFDPRFTSGNDTDWFFRASEAGLRMAIIEEVLLLRRFHHSNQTRDLQLVKTDMMRILKASIDRRRGKNQ